MHLSLDELTDLFGRLGAYKPEDWARSQAREGIGQLHRFLFLRQAWKCVVSEDDDAWIERYVDHSRKQPSDPQAGVGRALERLLERGAERRDIVDLVRGMQAELLGGVCYILSDPGLADDEIEDVRDIGWALVETDDEFHPTDREIGTLHESVLETDPTRREMRPRPE